MINILKNSNFLILLILILVIIIALDINFYVKTRLIRDKSKEIHFFITYRKMQKLFKKFNIKYVSNGGTLIGAVRDSKFLPWDYDMDFCTNYNNKKILFSDKFKKEAKKLKLTIEYYEKAYFWDDIGGLKISNQDDWDKGQIDIFFFSNKVNKDIYYLGNDGNPHKWEEESYKKSNLFPIRQYNLEFPSINKVIQVPCPNKAKEELSRHFGEQYVLPPSNKKIWYLIDKIIYSQFLNTIIILILILIVLLLIHGLYLICTKYLNFGN
jgi:hypothetical protein